MEQEYENTVKPQRINEEKFKKEAEIYFKQFDEYKRMDKMMKQYEANIKDFMVRNKMSHYEDDYGMVSVMEKTVNRLDRSLIDDIHQYYRETRSIYMYKATKAQSANPPIGVNMPQ
jgi:hypothetical protein